MTAIKRMMLGFVLLFLVPNFAISATIRLAASTPLTSFADPLVIDTGNGVIPSVFDGLTNLGREGQVLPALATSWEAISGTVWVFKLRPDVVFSDGTPFDAKVVVDNFALLLKSDSARFPIAAEVVGIAAIRALDSLTVEFTTKQVDAVLPRKLNRIKMIHTQAFARLGRSEFSKAPVGTGSYKIESWRGGGSTGLVMVAAKKSWRAPEQIDRVEYVILPDQAARLQSLMSGAVDIANNVDPDTVDVLKAAGYRVIVQPGPVNLSIAFPNCIASSSPVQDIRVRRALSMAVDKERISKTLLGGLLEVATQGATPDAIGYNPEIHPISFDQEAARQLLKDAGVKSGFHLVVGIMTGQIPGDESVFQQVAQDWASIGVTAELRRLAFPEYLRRLTSGDWSDLDAFSAVWSHYQLGDISPALKKFIGATSAPLYCAPELLDSLAKSDGEMDQKKRQIMLQEMMAQLHELVPALPLVRYSSINALSPRVLKFESKINEIMFGVMRVSE